MITISDSIKYYVDQVYLLSDQSIHYIICCIRKSHHIMRFYTHVAYKTSHHIIKRNVLWVIVVWSKVEIIIGQHKNNYCVKMRGKKSLLVYFLKVSIRNVKSYLRTIEYIGSISISMCFREIILNIDLQSRQF